MELPPRLGLGTIFVPLADGLAYPKSMSGVKVKRSANE